MDNNIQSICATCKNEQECPATEGIYNSRYDWMEPLDAVVEYFGEEDLPTETIIITNCPKYRLINQNGDMTRQVK